MMSLSRRGFLKMGGLAALGAAVGCESVKAARPSPIDPAMLFEPPLLETDRGLKLLGRAGFGPRAGDIERVRAMGYENYLEAQLNPETIDDSEVEAAIARLSHLDKPIGELLKLDRKEILLPFLTATVLRKILSERQLYEAMVTFWSDHFNIFLRKNGVMPLFKVVDDRDVVRRHALGNFRDLLFASAKSPAMLIYLDNATNSAEAPNENYARELMELHTVGIDAGYTQQDVEDAARILTGWSIMPPRADDSPLRGEWLFRARLHDEGAKTVLGRDFPPNGGQNDVPQLLDMLASHPATAQFIATKLVRRFVADEPPPTLVSRVAEAFIQTDGDIKAMLRVIFLSAEFEAAPPKLKRPFAYLISMLRGLGATVKPSRHLNDWLNGAGQGLFLWPAPNGYPDVARAWADNLLPRWSLAFGVVHETVDGVAVDWERLLAGNIEPLAALDHLSMQFFDRPLSEELRAIAGQHIPDSDFSNKVTQSATRDVLALMLAGPDFQFNL